MIKEAQHRWKTAALRLLGRDPAGDPDLDPRLSVDGDVAYGRRRRLLSETDLVVYRLLQQSVGDLALVLPKVRAGDVVQISPAAKHLDQTVRADRKRIDFVICSCDTAQPWLVVLIDHWDEESQRYAARDQFVEQVILAAGLPLVRVRSNELPDRGQLRSRIVDACRSLGVNLAGQRRDTVAQRLPR
jgi:hypothetical protein